MDAREVPKFGTRLSAPHPDTTARASATPNATARNFVVGSFSVEERTVPLASKIDRDIVSATRSERPNDLRRGSHL
jgi:hypothetical protein